MKTEKESMIKKYPHQIWAAPRQFGTLSCAENLSVPKEDDCRNAPLEMHAGYSVFHVAIAAKDGSSKANIPVSDVPYILEEYRFQRDMLRKCAMTPQRGLAYTESLPERNCGNKTAAEVLQMENGMQILENARTFFQQNIQKYPKNQIKINAINEALQLYQNGKLNGNVPMLPPLYHREFKHKSEKNDKGHNLIYFIDISANYGTDSPWCFTIKNCYAPIKQGTIVPDMQKADPIKTREFRITQEEMDNLIFRLKRTIEMFETGSFAYQYKLARKYEWKPQS